MSSKCDANGLQKNLNHIHADQEKAAQNKQKVVTGTSGMRREEDCLAVCSVAVN